ncbi:unnamed protein product [Alopecurus aequalis]
MKRDERLLALPKSARSLLASVLSSLSMGLLSNRIEKQDLKVGDHIYTWRGIYVADDKVIHFTRGRGQEDGTGTVFDLLLASSSPSRSTVPCFVCSSYHGVTAAAATETNGGVTSSCLSCFLAGGALYRFEYAVNRAFLYAKVRKGTCTVASSDPDEVVVRRANYLLTNGFGSYNLLKNNCENFAKYCKTGSAQTSAQALSGFAAVTAIICVVLI